jgi:rod shape-determining protein MreD
VRNTAFFIAGLALILLQANLFRPVGFVHASLMQLSQTPGFWRWIGYEHAPLLHVTSFVPSLVLPLIVYMGVHEYSLARGAGVAFVLGYATDLTAIAPVGLFTFTFVALYVLARGAGVRLASQTKLMQLVLGFSFSLLHSVMLLVLLAIFGPDPYVPRAVYHFALPHAVATALIAPVVFVIAQRIHAATMRGSEEAGVRS